MLVTVCVGVFVIVWVGVTVRVGVGLTAGVVLTLTDGAGKEADGVGLVQMAALLAA